MGLMSISTPGCARRKFMAGIRLCPPARKRASAPCSALAASAAASESAAMYLNGAGFMAHLGLVDELAVADHRHRSRMLAQGLEHIRRFEHHEVGRSTNLKEMVFYVDG